MSGDNVTRREHREDIAAVHQRITTKDDEAREAREKINGKLDAVLALLSEQGKTNAALFASHQNLKNQVEGPNGEGGLKKKLNNSKRCTGARWAPFSFYTLFLGCIGK